MFFDINEKTIAKIVTLALLTLFNRSEQFVFGSAEGQLKLFNIDSGKLLYTFEGNGNSITCLGQTPALDVISVGTTSGDISLLHLKAAKTLFSLKQDTAVTALDYRSGIDCLAY